MKTFKQPGQKQPLPSKKSPFLASETLGQKGFKQPFKDKKDEKKGW
ncbi:MAG: hypothetical protein ABSF18_04230 [Gammaproteobacteria bacterium]|jgi:hypothetical protein